jgi:predicted HTH domain antitoxin
VEGGDDDGIEVPIEVEVMSTVNGTSMLLIEFPDDILSLFARTPEAFAKEMRLAAAIEWYREGRISQGQGAEIAGLDRVEFLDELFRAKVSACQVTVEGLMEEVDRVVEKNRQRIATDSAVQGRPA